MRTFLLFAVLAAACAAADDTEPDPVEEDPYCALSPMEVRADYIAKHGCSPSYVLYTCVEGNREVWVGCGLQLGSDAGMDGGL